MSQKSCDHCNLVAKCQVCSRCKSARYCSLTCQKAAWPEHKPKCAKYTAIGNIASLLNEWFDKVKSRDYFSELVKTTKSNQGFYVIINDIRVADPQFKRIPLTQIDELLIESNFPNMEGYTPVDTVRFIPIIIELKNENGKMFSLRRVPRL